MTLSLSDVSENVDELRHYLGLNGVQVIDEEPLAGAKRFYLSDPFGNRLEFLEWIQA